jgi:hypothetical protein
MLQTVVEKRTRRPAQPCDLVDYPNGRIDGDFANESTDVTNVWTRLRAATRRVQPKMDVRWTLDGNQQPQIQLNDTNLPPKDAEASLRSAVRDYFRRRLLDKPDQGKMYEVTSSSTPPNHFMHNGDFTRFAEWRFNHRARLDCVPLNATRRFGNGDR